jgi:nitrite reductase/ring-hydroxylating ferredoxin subunit
MRQPVDRYVDRLLRRRRPKPFTPAPDDLEVLRIAIALTAAGPDAGNPRPVFVEGLRDRLGKHAARAAKDQRPRGRSPVSRRVLAASALVLTGAATGAAGDRLLAGQADDQNAPQLETPNQGTWQTVAGSSALREGVTVPFKLGGVTGFLSRVSGRVQAVSRGCTHQGCLLDVDAARGLLACPCHGATFSLSGANLAHPRDIRGPLPALPRLPVREQAGQIQVYAPDPAPVEAEEG